MNYAANKVPSSVSHSITVRLEAAAMGRAVSELTHAVERAGGVVAASDVIASGHERVRTDVTCAAADTEHAQEIVEALGALEGLRVFRGLLDAQSREIAAPVPLAAARALAAVVSDEKLGPHDIVSSVFYPDVASTVVAAVRAAAQSDNGPDDHPGSP